MMLIALTNIRNDRYRLSRRSPDSGGACVSARILCAMSVQKHSAAPQAVPAARPNPDPDVSVVARLKPLPTPRITSTAKPAAKSP
jgi:hypothetical protein